MIIYTDGACSGNGSESATGGFGVVVLDDNENIIETYRESAKGTTNNRMELSAILWALAKYGDKNPIVYSDSAYSVNTLTNWMFGWQKNGWVKSNNQSPENLDLIKIYYTLWERGYRIQLIKVRGHAGNKWNELADKLATGQIHRKEKVLCQ